MKNHIRFKTERERKLFELKMKMNSARTSNNSAVVEEKKKEEDPNYRPKRLRALERVQDCEISAVSRIRNRWPGAGARLRTCRKLEHPCDSESKVGQTPCQGRVGSLQAS